MKPIWIELTHTYETKIQKSSFNILAFRKFTRYSCAQHTNACCIYYLNGDAFTVIESYDIVKKLIADATEDA
jgi:hypothetical protein